MAYDLPHPHCGGVMFRYRGASLPGDGDKVNSEDFEHLDGRPMILHLPIPCDTCGESTEAWPSRTIWRKIDAP